MWGPHGGARLAAIPSLPPSVGERNIALRVWQVKVNAVHLKGGRGSRRAEGHVWQNRLTGRFALPRTTRRGLSEQH